MARKLLFANEADVAGVLSMADAIVAVEQALRSQAEGAVNQPLRLAVRTPGGFLGAMPSAIAGAGLGAKLVTFFPGNGVLGVPTHNAMIALFDPETGMPSSVMDGRFITEIRTAATSAIATRALARSGARRVAMIGTGVQARSHVSALQEVGAIEELRIWGRTAAHADELAAHARERGLRAATFASVRTATSGADVICTVTPSTETLLDIDDVSGGAHINAVGSSAPHMRELGSKLLASAKVFVDTIEGAMNESGEIIAAIRDGALPSKPALTRLCDVVAGRAPGRASQDERTVFKSLGMSIEDVACAALVERRCKETGRGTLLDM